MVYAVGQTIYLYRENSKILYPSVVVEEVTKKTISGVETSYSIMLPDKDKTVIPINDIKANIFSTIEDFRKHAIESARENINKIILTCNNLMESNFPEIENNNNEEHSDNHFIMLEDGTRARIKMESIEKFSEIS